jgi:hypothetical protein
MRIIAFITDAPTVRDILAHLGEPIAPPRIAPARGPPLWAAADAEQDSPLDPALQPAPVYEFDQRLTW